MTFFVLVSINIWRTQFRTGMQRLFDDDDEDVVLNFVLGLKFVNPEQALPSIRGDTRPEKSPNIERFRIEMHHRMISDYFCVEPVYGPNLFCKRYRMQSSFFLRSWRMFLSETIILFRK